MVWGLVTAGGDGGDEGRFSKHLVSQASRGALDRQPLIIFANSSKEPDTHFTDEETEVHK